jgi:hypothetical protein
MLKKNGRLEWVCNLTPQTIQSYHLQPGSYVASWRARSMRGSIYTVEKKFIIQPNVQTTVEFFR